MANIKSAEKRARQDRVRHARNRWYRSRSRTFVKKARVALAAGDRATAEQVIQRACRALDRAAQKGVIHRNNAARRKSRLMRALHRQAE